MGHAKRMQMNLESQIDPQSLDSASLLLHSNDPV